MDPTTAMYVAQGIHGLAYGMMLFLVASGLTLIFGMMGILNIAHTAFFMLSAYFCYQVVAMTGSFWLALLIAPVATALVGIIVERYFLRKVHAAGLLSELTLTIGVMFVIMELVKVFWGTENLTVTVPPLLQGLINVGGLEYSIYRLFIIAMSFVVLIFLAFILFKTRLGMVVRAAVSDADMVNVLGINVPFSLHGCVRCRHMACRTCRSGDCPYSDSIPGTCGSDGNGRIYRGDCGRIRKPGGRLAGFSHIRFFVFLRGAVYLSACTGADVYLHGHRPDN